MTSANGLSDPLAISLVAQRLFNQNLLLTLIEAGALTQTQAGAVAGKTIDNLRDLHFEGKGAAFSDLLAKGFESLAADILGLKPLPRDPS